MNEIERYVRDVLHNIPASAHERARIEVDLRAHLQDALDNRADDEPVTAIIARMGSPEEVAQEFMVGIRLIFPLAILTLVLADQVPERDPQGIEVAIGAILILLVINITFVIVGLILLYFPILEGRFGQTLGKRFLGLRVVKETGVPIGFKEAFLRRLPFYFEFLVPDALFIPFTERRQRAFDILAKTVVIKESP